MKRLITIKLLLAASLFWVAQGGQCVAGSNEVQAAQFRNVFRIPKKTAVRLQAFKADPPEVALGERLFLETRFAQFFFAHSGGNANGVLKQGDPVLEATVTAGSGLPGPFAGMSMNCRACHLVAEQAKRGRGQRSYADYARRSPIPLREDGRKVTARNSLPIVNALINRRADFFLHNDGEFASASNLVKNTFTGRNFGWLPAEQPQAVRHIAHIIRNDDGKGQLAREFGGYSYRKVFSGTDSNIDEDYLIPEEFRVDIGTASDEQILDAIAGAVDAYMRTLRYSRDDQLEYDASPYDVFLEKNKLPRKPAPGQSDQYYALNLMGMLQDLKEPRFVTPADKCFKVLKQEFRFGPRELAGMKAFFARADGGPGSRAKDRSVGNCALCHSAPHFTDFLFHNTGAAQDEYDSIHGDGAFAQLFIPELAQRQTNYDAWLPATLKHPLASGSLCDAPSSEFPGRTDLGLWNVFANPDHPAVQPVLRQLLIGERRPRPPEILLQKTVALFKTPTLRGLAHSDPYLHTGQKDTLEDVVRFYIKSSALARAGGLRNPAPELLDMRLRNEDVENLATFLRALNEDYE